MKIIFFTAFFISLLIHVSAGVEWGITNPGVTSIFQPVLVEDTAAARMISILNQEIRIDVFQGYVVVRADYWFNNPTDENITILTGLPSCYDKADDCTNYYWMRIMINKSAPTAPSLLSLDSIEHPKGKKVLQDGQNTRWQTWITTFQPGVTQVTLNYGIATGAEWNKNGTTTKGNAFIYRFSSYTWWRTDANHGEMWLRMNDGYVTKDILGLLPDKKFLAGNSIVHAFFKDVVNDSTQAILLWYRKLDDAAIVPSHVSWEKQFYNVNGWVVNEKILATLSPFSATDYEGKAFQHEVKSASALLRWSLIAAVVIVAVFLILFIYSYKKKTA